MSIHKRDLGQDPVKDLGYYTDCQLATYGSLTLKKSSPKSELSRQRSICEGMIEACRQHGLGVDDLKQLTDRFENAKQHDKSLAEAA